MNAFTELYGKENVDKDLKAIKETKSRFAPEDDGKRVADIFEAIVLEHSELSNWLGSKARTTKTSEFDDIKNGTDLITEFDHEKNYSHLALAVDVTFSTKKLEEKFGRIKKEIEKGTLGEIKYFTSDASGIQGKLTKVPRVVIGIEHSNVLQLANLWVANKNKELASHEIQRVLLEEIRVQLQSFATYARQHKQTEAASAYDRARAIVATVIAEKGDAKVRDPNLSEDRIFSYIVKEMRAF